MHFVENQISSRRWRRRWWRHWWKHFKSLLNSSQEQETTKNWLGFIPCLQAYPAWAQQTPHYLVTGEHCSQPLKTIQYSLSSFLREGHVTGISNDWLPTKVIHSCKSMLEVHKGCTSSLKLKNLTCIPHQECLDNQWHIEIFKTITIHFPDIN
jgi:hypothetical protein